MEENQEKKVDKTKNVQKSNSTFSIVSFILGLLSIAFFYFTIVSVRCAILAIVFAVLDKKITSSTFSVAGLVMGIITLALYVIVLLACLAIGNAFEGIVPLIETILK